METTRSKWPVALKLIIFFALVFVLGFILALILGVMAPADANGDVPDWTITTGFISAFVISVLGIIAIVHNNFKQLGEEIKEMDSDILVIQKHGENILSQMQILLNQHLEYEQNVYRGITKDRKLTKKQLKSLQDIQCVILEYPKLGTDQSFMTLLQEISKCENKLMRAKMDYNACAVDYNTGIKCFPVNIFSKMCGMHPIEYCENVENQSF